MADPNGIKFTIINNKDHQTDIGLILAHEDAVNKEDIYITKSSFRIEPQQQSKKKKGLFSFLKK